MHGSDASDDPAGYESRVSLNIGKTRDVLVSYAANPGRSSMSRRHSSLRSSPVTSVATTGKRRGSYFDCDSRVFLQVVIPVRVRRSSALGRRDDHVVPIRQIGERIHTLYAGARPDVVDEEHMGTLEVASDLARVRVELLDDLLVPVAGSARLTHRRPPDCLN
jgi:hypothetical protein